MHLKERQVLKIFALMFFTVPLLVFAEHDPNIPSIKPKPAIIPSNEKWLAPFEEGTEEEVWFQGQKNLRDVQKQQRINRENERRQREAEEARREEQRRKDEEEAEKLREQKAKEEEERERWREEVRRQDQLRQEELQRRNKHF